MAALWEVWRVDQARPPKITTLGRLRADSQPAAMLKAFARWPNEPQERLAVRPVKWLNTVRREAN